MRYFPIRNVGSHGYFFEAEFPFSFVFYDEVQMIIEQIANNQDETSLLENVEMVLKEKPIGTALDMITRIDRNIIVSRYLRDFVRIVYRSGSTDTTCRHEEYELVVAELIRAVYEVFGWEDTDHVISVAAIHIAYIQMEGRFHSFSRALFTWDKGLDYYSVAAIDDSMSSVNNEMVMDMRLLSCMLDHMRPTVEQSTNVVTWVEKFVRFRAVVQPMLQSVSESIETTSRRYGPNCRRVHKTCRSLWMAMEAYYLFLLHTKSLAIRIEYMTLWTSLESVMLADHMHGNGFRSLDPLLTVVNFCNECCERISKINEREQLRERCQTFFVDFVGSTCFSGNTPPNADVMEYLFSMATDTLDKRNSFFQQAIGENNTSENLKMSTFLIKLLIKCDSNVVKTYLSRFLTSHIGSSAEILRVCTTYTNCIEDQLRLQCDALDTSRERYEFVVSLMDKSDKSSELNHMKLRNIAVIKLTLSVAAEILYRLEKNQEFKHTERKTAKKILNQARDVYTYCATESITETSIYLMHAITEKCGLNALLSLANQHRYSWIIPKELQRDLKGSQMDTFALLGCDYTTMRSHVKGALFFGDVRQYSFKGNITIVQERNLLLAILQTVMSLNGDASTRISDNDQIIENLNLVTGCVGARTLTMVMSLAKNKYGKSCQILNISKGQTGNDNRIISAVVHLHHVLNCVSIGKLAEPLSKLALNPKYMQGAFLPTMPEDNLTELKAALSGKENLTFYECPNGHKYSIGDCGRPRVVSTCPECHARIGGQGHQALAGNKVHNINDNTSPGHTLGSPNRRNAIPEPERQLSPSVTAIIRMMVHLSMLIAANEDPEGICCLIKPVVGRQNVIDFLLQHITIDLSVISKAVSKNEEECLLLLHLIMDRMLQNIDIASPVGDSFLSRGTRSGWEKKFAESYLNPIVNAKEDVLRAAREAILSDNQSGETKLLKILSESVGVHKDVDISNIENNPCMWTLRQSDNVESLIRQVNDEATESASKQEMFPYSILQLFLRRERRLRAVQYLPVIIKLQLMLVRKLHRSIDRPEAVKMTITEFRNKYLHGHEKGSFLKMLHSFEEAWDLARGDLGTYGAGGTVLPAEYCDVQIVGNTSLAVLLPSRRGLGKCASALVLYILQSHNDCLEEYAAFAKTTITSEVSVKEVTRTQLIAFDFERDLMPLIRAHSRFTPTTGRTATPQYNLRILQTFIEDRFLQGRSRIMRDIPIIVFREDFMNAGIFDKLRQNINQEPISTNMRHQILCDFVHLTDINDCLAKIDVALGFLTAVGRTEAQTISEFVSSVLRLEADILDQSSARNCKISHIQALWMLLSHARCKMLTTVDQDPFDHIDEKYKEEVPKTCVKKLEKCLQREDLVYVMDQLYEYIIMQLTTLRDDEDGHDDSQYPLKDTLYQFIDDKDGHPILALTDDDKFPHEVLVKHTVDTWRIVFRLIKN